jgi:hypothetical protein
VHLECREGAAGYLTGFFILCCTAQIGPSIRAIAMSLATRVAAAQAGDQVMTKTGQLSTSTQGSLDKSAKIRKNVSAELTKDDLNKVSGGAIDAYMYFKDSTGAWLSGE